MGAEQKMVEQYGTELAKVSSLLSGEKLLRLLLESPTLPVEKKAAIMADVTASLQLSSGMKNFLGLLLTKDRLRYVPQIEVNYRQFADELSGIVRARIVSARTLSPEQQRSIQTGLEKKTGKKVELAVDLDPSQIGGIKAEIAGRVFDGSVRTQLKRIEDTLQKG
jgi:F-type H+-transporting ATPase subunit delta